MSASRTRAEPRSSQTPPFVSSANPRIVDGKPSKNPRYLQPDPNYAQPLNRYLARLLLLKKLERQRQEQAEDEKAERTLLAPHEAVADPVGLRARVHR